MKRKKVIILILLFILVLGISYVVYLNYVTAPYITSIEKNDDKRFPDRIIVNVHVENYFYKLNKDTWCFITNKDDDMPEVDHDDWKLAVNGYCNFSVPVGDYDIYVKDSYGNINSIETQKVKIDKVVQIKPEKNTYYLYKGQKRILLAMRRRRRLLFCQTIKIIYAMIARISTTETIRTIVLLKKVLMRCR